MVIHTFYDTDENKLEKAVLSMIEEYRQDQQLSAFTSLYLEIFYETKGNLAS